MRIKDFSAATGVPVDTIRHYEKAALLAAPVRSSNGYRDYGTADVARLRFIRHCRALDMNFAEVRELLDFRDQPQSDCAPVSLVIERHLGHVRERLAVLQDLEHSLQDLLQRCQSDERGCGIVQALSAADQPEDGSAQPLIRPRGGVHTGGTR